MLPFSFFDEKEDEVKGKERRQTANTFTWAQKERIKDEAKGDRLS